MPIRPLSRDLQEKAAKEFGENPKRIEDELRHIREWAEKQPHFRFRTDDQWLVSHLRANKYSLEKLKRRFELISTVKTALPEYFSDRDTCSPKIQKLLKMGLCLPLLKPLSSTGPAVILFRTGKAGLNTLDYHEVIPLCTIMLDLLLLESDNAALSGAHAIIDAAGMQLQDAARITPDLIKKATKVFEKAYDVRPQRVHVINITPFVDFCLNQFKGFPVGKKIFERLSVYNEGYEKLYETIPQALLPKEYGGNGESVNELTEIWKKKAEDYQEWFINDAQHCLDISKCPLKITPYEDLFGTEGSFRRLDFD